MSKAIPVPQVDAVVIGRNEGARMVACLASLKGQVRRVIYVDSGSTDASVQNAQDVGAEVVQLDTTQPFTAARARNAGLALLDGDGYVQLVDGDCVLNPDWINRARDHLTTHPDTAIVCGRRREASPDASVYNRLCDREWNGPSGVVLACGGDALVRLDAFRSVEGFNADLIAGEEPEMCVRLRQQGWKIWRLDHEMTLHDAAMTRFSQWWARMRRAGHAFAEGSIMHGAVPERHWVRETRRALIWGAILPLLILIATVMKPAMIWLALIYPLQVIRLALRDGLTKMSAWEWALFSVIGRFAEASGALRFYVNRKFKRQAELIEYK